MMDMLLGLSNNYQQFKDAPIRHYVNQTPSAYAMDNWHVTPRLSLQLGLRYDALPHAWERSNAVSNFDPRLSTSPASSRQLECRRSMDPDRSWLPVLSTESPFYLNGIGLAGVNGFPPGLVNERLQHAATSRRLL